MAVSQDSIEKIKQLPVSAILSSHGVALKRIGREFVTKCLWHNDKNPSLTVSDDKGFVFCHVCQEHNDAIGYIQKHLNLNFREACEKIASTHGINISFVDENKDDYKKRQEEIRACLDHASAKHKEYRASLRGSKEVINYINCRGILPETSREFGLGYDKRENRLTVPIYNHKDELVGFTGRALGDSKPKYKNTENNAVFIKSELVFNETKANPYIRESSEIVFVEGHLDVVALWQAGIRNVVALQGTASPSQSVIERLLRKATRFVLLMDGDQGGKLAVGKFLASVQDYMLSGKLDVRVSTLPDGMDPDEAIKAGIDLSANIASSPSWMDWVLDDWLNDLDFEDVVKVQNVERLVKETFSKIASPALRAHYFDKASIRLARNKQGLAVEIAKNLKDSAPQKTSTKTWSKPDDSFTRKMAEKRLLRLYVHKRELREILLPLMDKLHYPNMIWLWNRIKEFQENSVIDSLDLGIIAIIASAESHYLQSLRPILVPTVRVDDESMVIAHLEDIMMKPVPEE